MASAEEHASVVLAAILPRRLDLLNSAAKQLTEEHFTDQVLQNIWLLLIRYMETTGAVMSTTALTDALRDTADPGRVAQYVETFEALTERSVDDSDFKWSVLQLREIAADEATKLILTEGMEIMRRGRDVDGELVKGHEAAKEHILDSLTAMDRGLLLQDVPEGDIRNEAREMMQEYVDAKKARLSGTNKGILFGITELDEKLGGLQPGELIFSAGYSSDGKTSLCVQLAWAAAVQQGKNVLFITVETLRPQVRRKIWSRHSKLEKFGLEAGLNTRDLKSGALNDAEEVVLRDVVIDLTQNPDYGRVYIAQVPHGSTVGYCEALAHRLQRSWHVDLIVIDYLALLAAPRKRNTEREELSAIVKDAKQFAVTFDNGRGVPIVSPWQVNRTSRAKAEEDGAYTSAALSATSEATSTADLIISLLAPTENNDRYAEVKGQVLKNRDGETAGSIMMDVDYATSTFVSKSTGGGSMSWGDGFGTGGLDDLI